jgi:hypothetical protein
MRSVDRTRMIRKIGSLQMVDLTTLLATLREMFEECPPCVCPSSPLFSVPF